MAKITVRRTFGLGNFETITLEGVGEHDDPNIARLLASRQVLEFAQIEMIRIFNVRIANVHNNPYEQVQMELNGVNAELGV